MTLRQWVILQQALVTFETAVAAGRPYAWDAHADGPVPTADECAALAEAVGTLEYVHAEDEDNDGN